MSILSVQYDPEKTGELDSLLCRKCLPTLSEELNTSSSHVVVSSRLRIANLCCAGEEKIIRNVLRYCIFIIIPRSVIS